MWKLEPLPTAPDGGTAESRSCPPEPTIAQSLLLCPRVPKEHLDRPQGGGPPVVLAQL